MAITSIDAFRILGLTKSSPDEVFGLSDLIAFLTCVSVTSLREKWRFFPLCFSFSFEAGSWLCSGIFLAMFFIYRLKNLLKVFDSSSSELIVLSIKILFLNFSPHMEHSFKEWPFSCSFNTSACANLSSHWEQQNGFSLVWVCSCWLISVARSFLCILLCSKYPWRNKIFPPLNWWKSFI